MVECAGSRARRWLWLLPAMLASACAFERYVPAPLTDEVAATSIAEGELVAPAHATLLARLGAGSVWPPASWTPDTLGVIAVYRSRLVKAAAAAVAAASAAQAVAAQGPNPRVAVTLERNSDLDPGDDSHWSVGPGVSYLWSPVARGRIRAALAATEVVAARSGVLEAAWTTRHAAVRAALALAAARRQAQLREAEAGALAQAVTFAGRQVEAGVAEPYDWQTLMLEQNSADLARIDDIAAVGRAGGDLAGALALPLAALGDIALEFACPPDTLAYDTVQRRALLEHPAVLRALAAYDKAERDLELAVAAQYPDIELSPGYLFEQGDNVWSLVGGVVVPLFARHDTAIAAAHAARDAARERVYAVQSAAIAQVQAAWSAWQGAQMAASAVRELAAGIATRADELAARAAAGRADNLSLARAELQRAAVRREQAAFEAAVAAAAYALEYAARAALFDAPFARYLRELHDAGPED